jgi:lipopolysaccharide biosynthesis glycosyltransferase
MFIMKKDIFFDYCKWMFDILFKLKNIIPYKGRTAQENRALGYLAERLTGLFLYKVVNHEHKKIKELSVSVIENTDIDIGAPVPDNDVHVAVASSNEYVPYLSVILEAIKSSSDNDVLYHIHVLQRNISDINKEKLRKQFADTNILLHFVAIKEDDVNVLKKNCSDRHFSVDTYSRFFIPRLLPHLSKCLYLDIDMIVLDDIKKLYFTDLESHSLGVVRDWVYAGLCETAPHLRQYTHKTLGLDDPSSYFQGGVQLMNLSKMRSNNTEAQLLKLAQTMKVYFVDQCISNYFYKNDVTYFPLTWNYQINDKERQDFGLLRSLPVKTLNTVLETRKSPKIVHFSGPFKPWFYPAEEYAEIWWKYARQTPFYEEILARMIDFKVGNLINSNKTTNVGNNCMPIQHKNVSPSKVTLRFLGFLPIYKKKIAVKGDKIKTKIYLLGIPVIKKTETSSKKKIRFLGLPIWKTKAKANKQKGYLFGFIPLIKYIKK